MRPLVALAALLIALSPSHAQQQKNPRNSEGEIPKGSPTSPSQLTFIGQQQPSAPEEKNDAKHQPSYREKWLEPSVLSNLALVAAAIWAGCIALGTLEKVSASTKAMEKSVRLQEAQLEQWIDTTDQWESRINSPIYHNSDHVDVRISCGIVNPTKMMLTLSSVGVKVGSGEKVSGPVEYVLWPEGTPYSVELMACFSGPEFLKYRASKLEVPAIVSVQFEDAFGVSWSQTIEYSCSLGEGRSILLTELRNKKPKRNASNG